MNKRYMDFVPVGTNKAPKAAKIVVPEPEIDPDVEPTRRPHITELSELEINQMFEAREVKPRAGVSMGRREPNYGVIEDYQPKFVKAEIEKRPLSKQKTAKEEVKEVKAKKIERMPVLKKVAAKKEAPKEKVVEKEKVAEKPKEEKAEALKIPKKTPFVNTEKVAKRPLSKNVYQKQVASPKEEASGPVTIINKPEKDSKVGLIVTIIITIILGAAAGTVAFLLLPK